MLPCWCRATPFYYLYIAPSVPFSNPGLFTQDPMVGALRTQSTACTALGSHMYGDLFTALAEDYEDGGEHTQSWLAAATDQYTTQFHCAWLVRYTEWCLKA